MITIIYKITIVNFLDKFLQDINYSQIYISVYVVNEKKVGKHVECRDRPGVR